MYFFKVATFGTKSVCLIWASFDWLTLYLWFNVMLCHEISFLSVAISTTRSKVCTAKLPILIFKFQAGKITLWALRKKNRKILSVLKTVFNVLFFSFKTRQRLNNFTCVNAYTFHTNILYIYYVCVYDSLNKKHLFLCTSYTNNVTHNLNCEKKFKFA